MFDIIGMTVQFDIFYTFGKNLHAKHLFSIGIPAPSSENPNPPSYNTGYISSRDSEKSGPKSFPAVH